MPKTKHCDCAHYLKYFTHRLLRYDYERIKHDLFAVLL